MKRALILFVALLVVAGAIVGVVLAKTHKDKVTLPAGRSTRSCTRGRAGDTADHGDPARPAARRPRDAGHEPARAVPGSTAIYTRTSLVGDGHRRDGDVPRQGDPRRASVPIDVERLALARALEARAGASRGAPSDLYPGLGAGHHLSVARVWPARASDPRGRRLGARREPRRSSTSGSSPTTSSTPADLAAVKFQMKALLGVDPATIDAVLHAPGVQPFFFVPCDDGPEGLRSTRGSTTRSWPLNGVVLPDRRTASSLAGPAARPPDPRRRRRRSPPNG